MSDRPSITPPSKPWVQMTDKEKTAYVLRWHPIGYSAADIAQVAGCSRGAVLGVTYRHRQRNALTAQKVHAKNGSGYRRVVSPPIPLPANLTREQKFEPLPGSKPRTLMESHGTCLWAVDGIEGPSQLFCGLPAGYGPTNRFCSAHYRLCYIPVTEYRNRVAKKEAA